MSTRVTVGRVGEARDRLQVLTQQPCSFWAHWVLSMALPAYLGQGPPSAVNGTKAERWQQLSGFHS